MRPNLKILVVMTAIGLALPGCVSEEVKETAVAASSGTSGADSGDDGSTSSPVASISAGVYLKVEHAWENDEDNWTEVDTCTIAEGAAPSSSNCAMSLPEAQMFFGRLRFTVGSSDADTCKIVIFQPYYYRGEDANVAYQAPWDGNGEEVDCSDWKTAGCYDGVATQIVENFPKKTAIYFLPTTVEEMSFTVDSAHSYNRRNNRFAANGLTDQVTADPGYYVGNSMVNYAVECRDEWMDPIYDITLTLSDEDTSGGEVPGGPLDHFSDWND